MTALPPRPLRYALAWAGAAGVAVTVGLLAVSLLGGGARPALAAGATAPAASSASAPTADAPGAMVSRDTDGGVVYGTCAGPAAVPSVSGVPATGWEIDPSGTTVTFEREDREIRVAVGCDAGGAVTFAVSLDDRGGSGSSDDASPAASSTPPAAPSTPADDHGGASASATSGGGSGSGSGSGSGGSGSGSGSGGSGSGGSGSGSGGGSGGHGSDD